MIRPSFVPPPPFRKLRDLTRYRAGLVAARTAEKNRVEKLLEDGLFSELPDVAAAQKPKRLRRRATALTGMSLSVGRDGCDLDPGATESGHSVPNGSPSFSSSPLVDASP